MHRYHWSVEYFEDLRNINHCEFVIMERNQEHGRYILQNKLRTWSELKRKAAAEKGITDGRRSSTVRDGECPDNCDHVHDVQARGPKRRNTGFLDVSSSGFSFQPRPATPQGLWSPNASTEGSNRQSDKPEPSKRDHSRHGRPDKDSAPISFRQDKKPPVCAEEDSEAFPRPEAVASITERATAAAVHDMNDNDSTNLANLPHNAASFSKRLAAAHRPRQLPDYKEGGRDFGGTFSGAATPTNPSSPSHSRVNSGDYFASGLRNALSNNANGSADWTEESGMGSGAMADALGDQSPQDTRGGSAGDVVADAAKEDDLGGAEHVGLAKAGEAVTGKVGVGKAEAGREHLARTDGGGNR